MVIDPEQIVGARAAHIRRRESWMVWIGVVIGVVMFTLLLITTLSLNSYVNRSDCQQHQLRTFSQSLGTILETAVDNRTTTAEGQREIRQLQHVFDQICK